MLLYDGFEIRIRSFITLPKYIKLYKEHVIMHYDCEELIKSLRGCNET